MSLNEYSLRKAFFGKHYVKQDVDEQIGIMNREMENLEEKVRNTTKERDDLMGRLRDGESVLTEREATLTDREEQIESLQQMNEELEQAKNGAEEQVSVLERERATMKAQIEEMKAAEKESTARFEALRKDMEKKVAELEKKHKDALTSAGSEAKAAQDKLTQEMNNKLSGARNEAVKALDAAAAEKEKILAAFEAEKAEMLASFEAEKAELLAKLEAEYGEKNEELTQEMQVKTATIKDQSKLISTLEKQVSEQKDEIQRLQVFEPLKEEVERLREEGHKKDMHGDSLEDELRECRINLEQAERRIQRLSAMVDQQKHKIEEYDGLLEDGSVEKAEVRAKRILAEATEKQQQIIKEAEEMRERVLAAAKSAYYNTLQFKVAMAEQFSGLEREIDNSVSAMRTIEMPNIPDLLEAGHEETQNW